MMRSSWELRHGTTGLAVCVSLLIASGAWAASNVSFQLELGGNNHASSWKAGTPVLFTPGSTADGQVFPLGTPITWAVRLAASGTQENGPGAGQPIWGVANFVFDLKLHEGSPTGPLATAADFKSSINDGNNGDILAAASFALSYMLGGGGPARVVDPRIGAVAPALNGGPLCGGVDGARPNKLRSATYPKDTPNSGMLIGMGAGYNAWYVDAGSLNTTPGLGMVTLPNAQPGLGIVPVCEGQIDTAGLTAGTYVLEVIPGEGINVLRGDVNLGQNQNAFATAVDGATGSSISFVLAAIPPTEPSNPSPANGATNVGAMADLSWTAGSGATSHIVYFGTENPPPQIPGEQSATTYDPGTLDPATTYYWRVAEKNVYGTTLGPVWSFTTEPGLSIVSWQAVRDHNGTSQNITIPATGFGVESRSGGLVIIAATFTRPCDFVFAPTLSGSDGTNVEFTDGWFDLETLTWYLEMPVTAVDGVCYSIQIPPETFANDGSAFFLSGDNDCSVLSMVGDTTANGKVNLGDALYIRSRSGQPVSGNAHLDINLDGVIDSADIQAAKALVGATGACP